MVEAGGTKEQMAHYQASVDWTLNGLRVRCNALLAPVLASRTCNRW